MGCKNSTAAVDTTAQAPAEDGSKLPPQATVEAKEGGAVEIYGVYASMNCMGSVMIAEQSKCGKMVPTMPGEGTMTPEFLKMNPFHGVPTIKDGDLTLGESNCIMRYLAGTYAPELYINLEVQRRSFVDFAMDRFTSAMYPDVTKTIYVIMGFASAPADKDEAGKKCTENLAKFAEVFLKEKFIGGSKMSIADYKVAPFFHAYAHPKIKEQCKVEVPQRILQFNFDFAQACPTGFKLLNEGGGMSVKEILDSKSGHKGEMLTVKEGFKETVAEQAGNVAVGIMDFLSSLTVGGKSAVKVYGVTVSMNCMGPILFGKHAEIGTMEQCMPGEQSQSEAHKKIVPFGGVPAMNDGNWNMGESNAILRHMARSYAEEYYPREPKRRAHIDWAIDRFSFGMYNDVVATVYVCMGFAPAPANYEEALKVAGKKAGDTLKEFADHFLKEKFVGGEKISIADFKLAPFFAAYAHPRVVDKCGFEVPERITKFNADFLEACPAAALFSTAEGGFSICETLDAKTAAEMAGVANKPSATEKEMQEAMATEAQKKVMAPEEMGPNAADTATAPICGCCFP